MATSRRPAVRIWIVLIAVAGLLGAVQFARMTAEAKAPHVDSAALAAVSALEHPRIFFSRDEVDDLRERARTTHREISQPILDFAREQLNSSPPAMPDSGDLDGFRNSGNQMIALAFAYVITGEQPYLDLVRRNLLAYSQWEYWGDENQYGDRDLGHHQMLLGNAIAYDWIYNELSASERDTIGGNLARRARESYEATTTTETQWSNWWKRTYTQNHHWINHSALGISALVLLGDVPGSEAWLNQAVDQMNRASYLLQGIGDGSWHEGVSYQSYGLTLSLPFYYNLNRLTGLDLTPHGYMQNYSYWRIYNYLPDSNGFLLSYGDVDPRWGDSYAPSNILRFSAREYRDGHAEWMAQQILRTPGRDSSVYRVPWYVFEFLYYDPSIAAQPPDDLPLNRSFPDMEGVIWRTGWGPDDLVFGLKTGPPGGRFAYDRFTMGAPGGLSALSWLGNAGKYPFNSGSGADRFHTGHDDGDANTFYLYRGDAELTSEKTGAGRGDSYYHNTLVVDGKGQYRDPESGRDRPPEAITEIDGRLLESHSTDGFSYLIADAANRYRPVNSRNGDPGDRMIDEFRRRVLFVKPGYLLMVDTVKAGSPREYDWTAHFPGSVAVEGDWVRGTGEENQLLGVKVLAPDDFDTSRGNDGKPFIRVRPDSKVAETQFVTVLFPTDRSGWNNKPAVHSLGESPQAAGIRVLNRYSIDDNLMRYEGSDPVNLGPYSLQGQSATVMKDEDGGLLRSFLGHGSRLADADGKRTLIEAPGEVATVEAAYHESSLAVSGDNLDGVRIYGPWVDLNRVTINGNQAGVTRDGDYIVLPNS